MKVKRNGKKHPNGKHKFNGGNGAAVATVERRATLEPKREKLSNKTYEKELARLQIELVKIHQWVKHEGLKVVAIFEGRDAAGKGGVIKRITQCLNPRICRVVALGTPTESTAASRVRNCLDI